MSVGNDLDLPVVTLREAGDDELRSAMRELQLALLTHPIAGQALFRALIAEGRRFADTDEGRRWKDALADSDLIRRGRVVWEVATLKLLEEEGSSVLPSKLIEAFMALTRVRELEPFLASLFADGGSDGNSGTPDRG